jgi:hypothetical protein
MVVKRQRSTPRWAKRKITRERPQKRRRYSREQTHPHAVRSIGPPARHGLHRHDSEREAKFSSQARESTLKREEIQTTIPAQERWSATLATITDSNSRALLPKKTSYTRLIPARVSTDSSAGLRSRCLTLAASRSSMWFQKQLHELGLLKVEIRVQRKSVYLQILVSMW